MSAAQTLLVFAAEPGEEARLQLGKEIDGINDARDRSPLADQWVVRQRLATRPQDLQTELLNQTPLVVHFCGHGAGSGGLVLEDDGGNGKLVSDAALAGLFKLFRDDVACVVLNACYSRVQAEAIAKHIPYVIGMTHEIGDLAAIRFSRGFYNALFAGKPFGVAFEFGTNAIHLEAAAADTPRLLTTGDPPAVQVPEHLKPVLLGRGGPVPRLPRHAIATAPALPPPTPPTPDRDAVVRFNEQFQQRKKRLGHLRACKDLHDILHKIHSYRPQITNAAAGVGRPDAATADPQNVAGDLEVWLIRGREAVRETKTPDRPPVWFGRFEAAVLFVRNGLGGAVEPAELTEATGVLQLALRTEVPALGGAIELLCHLPDEELAKLNDDLIENAIELNVVEMIGLLDQLLARAGGGTDNLTRYAGRFRDLCQSLTGLIDDHDRCQKVDGAFGRRRNTTKSTNAMPGSG